MLYMFLYIIHSRYIYTYKYIIYYIKIYYIIYIYIRLWYQLLVYFLILCYPFKFQWGWNTCIMLMKERAIGEVSYNLF